MKGVARILAVSFLAAMFALTLRLQAPTEAEIDAAMRMAE
jgi:hypothetical protein